MPTLTKENGLYVLHLGSDENRFTVAWVGEVEAALNTVVADPAPLVTIADGKFFSNGLDLDWMRANPTEASDYTARVKALLARFLTLPVATVAAVNGHAFGAGSLLATAHDWRVMRSDRGYFCFPEVDIKLPFGRGFGSLIQAKFTPRTALDAMSTGRRYGGEDALTAGLVDATATEGDLLETARARVAGLADKDPRTLCSIKATMYAEVVERLLERG